jgi:hypothetical protein
MKEIKLSQGLFALVDDEDFEPMLEHYWHAVNGGSGNKYAARKVRVDGKTQVIFMHKVLARTPPGMLTDHINGNTLDNRKANLRMCNRWENARNRRVHKNSKHGFKGVHAAGNRFQAVIRVDRKLMHLGTFKTAGEAALKYNEAARELFGDFCRLNNVP